MKLPHYMTVEDGRIVKFECGWLYGACHFYPECSCESWGIDHLGDCGPGHERVHHKDCWMQDWFEVPEVWYSGEDTDDFVEGGIPDGMNRSGEITWCYVDEHIEWEFV